MLALSIRQPYAELILRGIKTVEYRSRATGIIGERFHIYAPMKRASLDRKVWSRDLGMLGGDTLPEWMVELAEQLGMIEPDALLPTGVIVGSAVIERGSKNEQMFEWPLAEVERAKTLRKPEGHPQPVWFKPF